MYGVHTVLLGNISSSALLPAPTDSARERERALNAQRGVRGKPRHNPITNGEKIKPTSSILPLTQKLIVVLKLPLDDIIPVLWVLVYQYGYKFKPL